MIFEITTPYDTQDCCDVHETLDSLFLRLATMVSDPGVQHEVLVVRWHSWQQREEEQHRRDGTLVLVDVDEMCSTDPAAAW